MYDYRSSLYMFWGEAVDIRAVYGSIFVHVFVSLSSYGRQCFDALNIRVKYVSKT